MRYGPIEATLDREQGSQRVAHASGCAKARTARCARSSDARPHRQPADPHLLRAVPAAGDLPSGQVSEIERRVLMDQLGAKLADELGLAARPEAATRRGRDEHQPSLMRIVAGKYQEPRGIDTPTTLTTRPTSDRVRQGFLQRPRARRARRRFHRHARVLDLFAGSGALGLEALSRGARFCLFVEDSAERAPASAAMSRLLHLTRATKIWRRDATQARRGGQASALRPRLSRSALRQGTRVQGRSIRR